jgi:hypothetical protein
MANKKFNFKTFTSFILFWTFLILLLSGVMLFVSPPGRVAHWTNWTLWGFTKEGWQGIHVWMALIFVIGGIFHLLKFNWKVFTHYLKTRKKGPHFRFEALISTVLFFLVFIGTAIGIPPFSSLLNFSESVSQSWEEKIGNPPVPHMEDKTLAETVEQLAVNLSDAKAKLRAKNWEIGGDNVTLKEIGKLNGVSPQDVYNAIAPKLDSAGTGRGVGRGAGRSSAGYGQSSGFQPGLGRYSIEELSKQTGVDLMAELDRLGIKAESHERWRTVAERAGAAPRDLLDKLVANSKKE